MNERFADYLRFKKLSQRKISELSGVAESTVSRFCGGGVISSEKLQKILWACEDLSLEWFFYGTGEMLRSQKTSMTNIGAFAGAEVLTDKAVMVKYSKGVRLDGPVSKEILAFLAEKDRIILEKDKVISERDGTIMELYNLLNGK